MSTKWGLSRAELIGKSLQELAPEVAASWDQARNGCSADQALWGRDFSKKVYWLCSSGHSFLDRIDNKLRYGADPQCRCRSMKSSQLRATVANNDRLLKLWDEERNEVAPIAVASGSHEERYWRCSLSHRFTATPRAVRDQREPCPYCGGRRLLTGFNDAATVAPAKVKLWDYRRNTVAPHQILLSKSRYFFRCSQGHSFERALSSFSGACPYCSRAAKSFRSGAAHVANSPALMELWSLKNTEEPVSLTLQSGVSVLWVCTSGHRWNRRVCDVAGLMSSGEANPCPVCRGREVRAGVNDLASQVPKSLKFWAPENELKPDQLFWQSGERVAWRCAKRHSYRAEVRAAVAADFACSRCELKTCSKLELEFLEAVKARFPNERIEHGRRDVIPPRELDLYLPERHLAIEFNGLYWHSKAGWLQDLADGTALTREAQKAESCAALGIELLHIWEDQWLSSPEAVLAFIASKFESVASLSHSR